MKYKHFQTASALTAWVNDSNNANIQIVSIVPDMTNGGFTIFFR